ncbi:MAG TPA: MFS transporter [Clostridia bacterium]
MVPQLMKPLRAFRRKYAYVTAQPSGRAAVFFTFEGILYTLAFSMINNNNNLFAMRLGASDLQISLLTTFSQITGLTFLIPGAILTDRLSDKRRMVTLALLMLSVSYFLIGFTPFFGSYRYYAFLVLMSISVCPLTLYNTSWQAYFSDVIPIEHRNRILSSRTAGTFLAGMAVSLVCGNLLAAFEGYDAKIRVHQSFFWTASVLLIIQIIVLNRIDHTGDGTRKAVKLSEIKDTIVGLSRNKLFLSFLGTSLFFHMTWQSDWTLYFLGQVRYLGLNEAWLSYVSIGGTLAQFLSVGLWRRVNDKMGVRFGIIFGNIGLAGCVASMLIATGVPASAGPVVFLVLNTLSNVTYPAVQMNLLQCLLQVAPEKNKTLSISIYTMFITLSNAFMPMAGVAVYTALGGDLSAYRTTFWIIFCLRIISTGLWTLRWYLLRNEPK